MSAVIVVWHMCIYNCRVCCHCWEN